MAVDGPGAETRPCARRRADRGEEATMVRLPDAAGQLKNAPVKAIRGFFSGIGQLLLAADRFRAEDAGKAQRDDSDGQPTGLDGTPAGQMTTADYVRSTMPDAAAAKPETRKTGQQAPRKF